jgi:hypothetical protein
MLKALLHAKLDGEFVRSPFAIEDLLTSVVLGSCAYVPPDVALLPFLRLALSVGGDSLDVALADAVDAESTFWPDWAGFSDGDVGARGAQPELVVTVLHADGRRSVLLVEVKLHSGKSSEATEAGLVSDQLAKYWLHLRRHAETIGARPIGVVYVTTSSSLPVAELAASQGELVAKGQSRAPLYWVSWRKFVTAVDTRNSAMLRDVVQLLRDRWNLVEIEMPPWPSSFVVPRPWRFTPTWTWREAPLAPGWAFKGDS